MELVVHVGLLVWYLPVLCLVVSELFRLAHAIGRDRDMGEHQAFPEGLIQ